MEEQTDNKNLPTVKILISYHKPAVLLKDEVLTPIHVGRALATESSKDGSMSEEDYKWMLENMIGDDTGDNISHLNRTLNELTSMYWAWKNYDKLGNPDYIGFMHYRRHLNFNIDRKYKENEWGLIDNNIIDENYIDNYNLKADYIKELVGKYDILVANKWNVNQNKMKNNYEQYEKSDLRLHVDDYNEALSILEEKYPNYKEDIKNYNFSKYGYYTNIFIMKKSIFFDYCKTLFNIIFELHDKIDISNYNLSQARATAYISEWLFGIYLFNIIRNKKYKILELQRTFVHNLDIIVDIHPKFQNGICICFASDNNYATYLAVAIKSLIENANKDLFYEIYILNDNIETFNKNRILEMSNSNIYIRFIEINLYIKSNIKNKFYTWGHFSESAYSRFFIPRVFKHFEKILYLDCDLIILDDISQLYNLKFIKNELLLACHDTIMRLNTLRQVNSFEFWQDYLKNKLKLKNIHNYFQSGVLLLNIPNLIKYNYTEKCINILTQIVNPLYLDQDILNIVCEENIRFIDLNYNVEWCIPIYYSKEKIDFFEKNIYRFYVVYNNPKIMHYCGNEKPWTNPNYPKSNLWWKYARMTDFYEEIIYKNTHNNNYYNTHNNRFSIADFILSFVNNESELSIMFLGIKIRIKKNLLQANNIYYNKKDRIFSIYKNNRYTRITILGIKITIKNKVKLE